MNAQISKRRKRVSHLFNELQEIRIHDAEIDENRRIITHKFYIAVWCSTSHHHVQIQLN